MNGPRSDTALMELALAAARTSGPDDVPVGAVVFDPTGRELSRSGNVRERDGDPAGHAEVVALREAARRWGDGWRLLGCTVVVTLEPCVMCAGAITAARIGRLVFGAWEPRSGAAGSLWDVVRDRRLTHRPQVVGGVREAECVELVTQFFRGQRSD